MSGDHHTNHPVHGTAAGDAYIALPPTAVDATVKGSTRLIVAWPGFDPPRTASALAAAVPMTGVPVWRVYLDLPGRSPGGLGSGAILETETIETYCAAVESAVERLPAALADIRRDLGLADGPVALAGFSVGGAAALLAVARDAVPVTALALVTPVVSPSRAARAVEKRSGRDRTWSDSATALADGLDLGSLAENLAGRNVATLLIGGAQDRVVPAGDITSLRDALRQHGTGSVESTTFRMGHALAAEPGTEARPPITEAVRVDGALTDWFRTRLARSVPVRADKASSDTDARAVDTSADAGFDEVDLEQTQPDGFDRWLNVEPPPAGARPTLPDDPRPTDVPLGAEGDGTWSNGPQDVPSAPQDTLSTLQDPVSHSTATVSAAEQPR
ncbi:hypothetical protein D0T12_02490 [Actinomadura spongiicola]|uniref:Peptidase S9 prolyl oligopeptidase catalytic domain-containing protein n=1 Tax=Actinomadura spongiicola TaxID=2303421 RepID=A0A372GP15_9ACTN|nr:hypothetical protein [Actinomadura spongiicola]RFS87137.1 hypothetical protein D0T12_02490 [Actinomadura spongiicola]